MGIFLLAIKPRGPSQCIRELVVTFMGVSENTEPKYSTPNNGILIVIRHPQFLINEHRNPGAPGPYLSVWILAGYGGPTSHTKPP